MCVCTQLTCEFHAEARVGYQESSSTALCLILLKQGLSLNSKLVCSARLAGQQAGGSACPQPPRAGVTRHVQPYLDLSTVLGI